MKLALRELAVFSVFVNAIACAGSSASAVPTTKAQSQLGPPTRAATGPTGPEQARYKIQHAVFGEIGEVVVSTTKLGELAGAPLWRGQGHAFGQVLGFGESSTFWSIFNASSGLSTKWSINRDTGSAKILDECEQRSVGEIASHRVHSEKPEDWSTLQAGLQTTDPFGFVMRLRTHPPKGPEAVMVLDGRALWHVTVAPAGGDVVDAGNGHRVRALRYKLVADPLDWQRKPSKTRERQDFLIWVEDDAARTPLALEMDGTFGNVRVELDRRPQAGVALSGSTVRNAQ